MAEYTSRDITTIRREFALRRPTDWAEVGKYGELREMRPAELKTEKGWARR